MRIHALPNELTWLYAKKVGASPADSFSAVLTGSERRPATTRIITEAETVFGVVVDGLCVALGRARPAGPVVTENLRETTPSERMRDAGDSPPAPDQTACDRLRTTLRVGEGLVEIEVIGTEIGVHVRVWSADASLRRSLRATSLALRRRLEARGVAIADWRVGDEPDGGKG